MRWNILLIEFDIQYVTQKSIKGSVLVDHLASLSITDNRVNDDGFLDEEIALVTSLLGWCGYFDGVQPTILDMGYVFC